MCVKMLEPEGKRDPHRHPLRLRRLTMHAIFKVWRIFSRDEGSDASHLFTLEKKPKRCERYVQDKVLRIDFDEKSVAWPAAESHRRRRHRAT